MSNKLDGIRDWEGRAKAAGFRVAGLAQSCGVSERELRNYFHDRRGSRPRDWILRIRLAPSLEPLRAGEPIKKVAALVGFNQQSHFARCFERVYGMSPSDYAKGHCGPPD